MGLRINQNIGAINAYRNLSATENAFGKSLEKLSSGFRINRAADDAAGLVISESLRSQIGGLKVAVRNSQDGVSLVQTAEGALTEVHSMLQRIRDLTVQAANGSNSQAAVDAAQDEVDQLVLAVTDIAAKTEFNGIKLLDATGGPGGDGLVTFQVGANATDTLAVQLQDMTAATLGVDALVMGPADAATTLAAVDAAITSVSGFRGELGAYQNRLEHTISNLGVTVENLTASESRIRDTDMAQEMVAFTRSQILSQAGTAMLAQANASSQNVLQLLRG
jgi:flagellin